MIFISLILCLCYNNQFEAAVLAQQGLLQKMPLKIFRYAFLLQLPRIKQIAIAVNTLVCLPLFHFFFHSLSKISLDSHWTVQREGSWK